MADAVDIREAQAHLSKLISRVQAGEEATISKAGEPVAKLVPVTEPKGSRRASGIDKGKVWIAPDAFYPMTEEELKLWYEGRPEDPLNR